MWHGKNTDELKRLNEEYYAMFGIYPWGYVDVDYGNNEYEEYVQDIKEAMKQRKEIPDLYPYEEE